MSNTEAEAPETVECENCGKDVPGDEVHTCYITDGGTRRKETDTPQCATPGCDRPADGISDLCGPCAERWSREWHREEWLG